MVTQTHASVTSQGSGKVHRVRLLWSEAGAVCDLGFCASLDRLKGFSPLRSWVLRPERGKGAVPGVCAAAKRDAAGVFGRSRELFEQVVAGWRTPAMPRPPPHMTHMVVGQLRTGTIRSLQKSRTQCQTGAKRASDSRLRQSVFRRSKPHDV